MLRAILELRANINYIFLKKQNVESSRYAGNLQGRSLIHLVHFNFSLRILARLMSAKFLHTEIREKGGAYGGGAQLSHNGIFTFYSYR